MELQRLTNKVTAAGRSEDLGRHQRQQGHHHNVVEAEDPIVRQPSKRASYRRADALRRVHEAVEAQRRQRDAEQRYALDAEEAIVYLWVSRELAWAWERFRAGSRHSKRRTRKVSLYFYLKDQGLVLRAFHTWWEAYVTCQRWRKKVELFVYFWHQNRLRESYQKLLHACVTTKRDKKSKKKVQLFLHYWHQNALHAAFNTWWGVYTKSARVTDTIYD